MTTAAPPPLTQLARDWEALEDYPSAVFSGIIPDLDHLRTGGYHVSIEDLERHGNAGDYSNRRTLDKSPPVTSPDGRRYSAAMDMSMAPADMARHYKRVRAVFDDHDDPRRPFLGYVNCWDGTSSSATRLDFQGNRVLTATADHKWHVHTDFPRAYVDIHLDPARVDTAMAAYLSVIRGESREQWLGDEDTMVRYFLFPETAGGDPVCWVSRGAVTREVIRGFSDPDPGAPDTGFADWNRVYPGATCVYPPGTADANGFPTVNLADGQFPWTADDVNHKFGRPVGEVLPPAPGELVPHTHGLTITGSVGQAIPTAD